MLKVAFAGLILCAFSFATTPCPKPLRMLAASGPTLRFWMDENTRYSKKFTSDQMQHNVRETIMGVVAEFPGAPWPGTIDVAVLDTHRHYGGTYGGVMVSHEAFFVSGKDQFLIPATAVKAFTVHELGHVLFLSQLLKAKNITLKDYGSYENNPFRNLVASEKGETSPVFFERFLDEHGLRTITEDSMGLQELVADLVGVLHYRDRDYLRSTLIAAGHPAEKHTQIAQDFGQRGFYKSSELAPGQLIVRNLYNQYHETKTFLADNFCDAAFAESSQQRAQLLNLVIDSTVELAVELEHTPIRAPEQRNARLIEILSRRARELGLNTTPK